MEPIFFGPSERSLYGVYHSPASIGNQNRAVVLCYPAGHEYMRIHRAYRQLASLLSRSGFHVLRFDYSGVGDSAGEHEDIAFSDWVDDTLEAIDELQAISGVKHVDLVGLRMGALVAAKASAELNSVKRLVLWEPSIDGGELEAEMRRYLSDKGSSLSAFEERDGALNFHGYRFSKRSLASFSEISLQSILWERMPSIYHVSSQDCYMRVQNSTSIPDQLAGEHALIGSVNWSLLDAIGGLYLPMDAVNEIHKRLEQ